MQFTHLDKEDWQYFHQLATSEGWLISDIERQLFLADWHSYAWRLKIGNECCGFVTAVPYQRTGWIGNLIVPPEKRGMGYGSTLFDFAVEQLEGRGIPSIWLTASEDGAPLYSSRGFQQVDSMSRLVLPDGKKVKAAEAPPVKGVSSLAEIDVEIWREERSLLTLGLISNAEVVALGTSVAALQPCGDFQMIGPWYTGSADEHYPLLQHLLLRSDRTKRIVVDVVASSPLSSLIREFGGVETGYTQLMVKGERHFSSRVGALASLGSMG